MHRILSTKRTVGVSAKRTVGVSAKRTVGVSAKRTVGAPAATHLGHVNLLRPPATKRSVGVLAASLLAGLAALAIFSSQAVAAAAAASAAGVPRCATSGLVMWLNTEGNGTAGSVYYELDFTNLSRRACTLSGYPGVSAVNLGGSQLGSAASRERSHTARLVTLAANATATASLRIVAAGAFPASQCHLTIAAGLRVYPPGQSSAKIVPFPFEACARRGPVYLSVQAIRKGLFAV